MSVMEKTYLHIAKKLRKDQQMAALHSQLTIADNVPNNATNWRTIINPRHHLLQRLLDFKEGDEYEDKIPLAPLPSISHQPIHTIPIDIRHLLLWKCIIAFVDLGVKEWPGGQEFLLHIQALWPKIYTLSDGSMINSYYKAVREARIRLKLENVEAFLLYMIYHTCDESNGNGMDDQELVVVAKSGYFFVTMILEGTQRIV